jgi:CRISPR-associated protein Csm3
MEGNAAFGPSRASFADCPLDEDWRKDAIDKALPLTEVKSENTIDRIKGVADNLRQTERVPADARFRFRVTLKEFEGDENLEEFLLEGFKLLEMDALGGNGSRGYGRVEFKFDDPERQTRFEAVEPL